ncbi:MAG TPA: efflux RND transporter periplasmic adaptor subunit [Burkholderiaceae bacterium]|nr:efflux RND transporter periplasmic adaptor subunit [Burkholderiaceae bacterium]
MNGKTITAAVATVGAALAVGYFVGRLGMPTASTDAGKSAATSTAAAPAGDAKSAERKLLYYRNPMGLPDTSPVPKKDQMGMDYIPVDEGEDRDAPGTVKVSADRIQTLGVRIEPVGRRSLARAVRAVGTIEINERGQHTVSPKFEGWIEKLHVNTTGQAVTRGQPLAEVYSPELVSAQREYLIAYGATKSMSSAGTDAQSGVRQLATAALERLRNWDISEEQLQRLRETGEPRRTLTLIAPASGIIVKDPPVAGMRFMPGEPLFRIADLSRVWMIGDVFEQDLALVRVGSKGTLGVSAYPDRTFPGEVTFIYPTLNTETRTARVRIELANPQGQLKPGMYGTVQIDAGPKREVIAMPESAVINSGNRQVVLVALGEGKFEPREVKLGARGDGFVEALAGVKEGDQVVTRANFLIDAESNLKASLGSFTAGANTNAGGGKAVVHTALGRIDDVDAKTGALTISHEPVPSLNWPKMTMEFVAANDAITKGARPGAPIRFEFVERKPGEWVITKIEPAAGAATPAAAKPEAHKH